MKRFVVKCQVVVNKVWSLENVMSFFLRYSNGGSHGGSLTKKSQSQITKEICIFLPTSHNENIV